MESDGDSDEEEEEEEETLRNESTTSITGDPVVYTLFIPLRKQCSLMDHDSGFFFQVRFLLINIILSMKTYTNKN